MARVDYAVVAEAYAGRPWFVLVAFYAHIVAGGTALVVGPFQFWRGLRTRHPLVHRSMGRVYLTAVGIAALGGLAIAPISQAVANPLDALTISGPDTARRSRLKHQR